MCVRENCLCPLDTESRTCPRSNLSEYLCSPGTDGGLPSDSSAMQRLLRVALERNPLPVISRVADRLKTVYGDQLYRFCHVYKEKSVYTLLLDKMKNVVIKLGGLLSVPIYDTPKHIARLGLDGQVPALCAAGFQRLPSPFLKEFQFKSGDGQLVAEGVGFNMWGLLLMTSLIGSTDIHTKNSSRVALSLLKQILCKAPRAATPGQTILVRSINTTADNGEGVVVPRKGQPESFLRPLDDIKFAKHGVYTYCPATEDHELPEDWLHCAQLLTARKLLGIRSSEWYEVPPSFLKNHYQLIPERYYSVWRSGQMGVSAATGTFYVDQNSAILRFTSGGLSHRVRMDVLDWHQRLAHHGFLLMPMIFRSGALVKIGGLPMQAGCLVPKGTQRSLEELGIDTAGVFVSNFDHVKGGYHAEHGGRPLMFMDPMVTLNNLVPVGQVMWIRSDSQTFGEFIDQGLIPAAESDNSEDCRCLECRLSVPTLLVSRRFSSFFFAFTRLRHARQNPEPGDVYVTVLERKKDFKGTDYTSRTITVRPPDLFLTMDDDYVIILKHLTV